MRNEIIYEWDIETVDEHDDIIDHSFSDQIPARSLEANERLVLVRRTGNEENGEDTREWAYLVDGKLPEYFTDELDRPTQSKIPVRFHNELAFYNTIY